MANRKQTANIHIRIDEKLKEDTKKILERDGIDMATAIRIYFRQIVADNKIPFKIVPLKK